jgi:hypothetical protein
VRPEDGVSTPPFESAPVTPPTSAAVLRVPAISQRMWYRVAALAGARGLLPPCQQRLVQFLSRQALDPTGQIVGQWGTGRTDGGMALAARYAYVHGIGVDRFWADLQGLAAAGFVARVVAPAPGRRAVYAIVLRTDAIPNALPEDIARALTVWDLPEAEDDDADVLRGRLSAAGIVTRAEPATVDLTAHDAAALTAAPRWEHPQNSPAALAAEAIAAAARRLPPEARPSLRCCAVVRPPAAGRTSPQSAMAKRLPLTRGVSPLGGCLTTGSTGLSWINSMAKTQTTPTAAPERAPRPVLHGDDPRIVAKRVLRRAWHAWRTQVGHRAVLLPSGEWDGQGAWQSRTASVWNDLQHVVVIALRRSTEGELVELLSDSVRGVDNVGRLAAWRLWRLINSRRNAHGYGRHRAVAQAAHVTAWDDASPEERRRLAQGTGVNVMAQLRAEARARAEEARAAEESRRRAQFARWGISTEPMREPPPPAPTPAVPVEEDPRQRAAAVRAAALARARAEKRARGRTG